MLHPPFELPGDYDELFEKALKEVVQYDRASASLLQRRLAIGYAGAARLISQLESAGVLSPAEGSKPRTVLIQTPDEILGNIKAQNAKDEEQLSKVPENYQIPKDIKLTSGESVPWGIELGKVIETNEFKDVKSEFPILLGYNEQNSLQVQSLLDIGNLIIAGNTISQKENFLDTILLTFLLRYAPRQLRFVLVDETHYLDLYNGIPHLLSPVINEYNRVISAFRWSESEMQRRMKVFNGAGVRDIASYNSLADVDAMPRILIITNIPFFDVETTDALTILTEQGIRAGIHNIVVVSRAQGESLPRNIKSNIPARVVFRTSSAGESKAIEVSGAEKLGPGEIIYKPNYGSTHNLKAIFTPEVNVKEVVQAVKPTALFS